jgi:protein gp37
MAESSSIAWCKSTFNPWIGCTKVGPGCDNCYASVSTPARSMAIKWGAGEPRRRTSLHNWNQPLKWNKQAPESEFAGRKGFWPVFCASLADVFDNEVPDEWRTDLWDLIDATPNLSWLLVTKRIGNVRSMIPDRWGVRLPDHVRILITVTDKAEADRDIPKLLALRCKNGISYEPALGPVDWENWLNMRVANIIPTGGIDGHRRIDWIIIGGESSQGGVKARPFNIEWAVNTIRQCKAAGVPVFMKQLGSRPYLLHPGTGHKYDLNDPVQIEGAAFELQRIFENSKFLQPIDRAGADPAEWPEDLRVREFPL